MASTPNDINVNLGMIDLFDCRGHTLSFFFLISQNNFNENYLPSQASL